MKEPLHRVVGGTATCVFLELQSYSHMPDGARPSINRVAMTLSLSRSTVQRAIRTLVTHGYLEVEQRREGKQQLASRYHFPATAPEVKYALPPGHSRPAPRSEMTYEPTTTSSSSSSSNSVGFAPKKNILQTVGKGRPTPKRNRGMRGLAEKSIQAAKIADILQRVRERQGCKPPSAKQRAAWEKTADLLLTKDARSCEEVVRVLEHTLADPYWMPKVDSMYYFRQRYDQFRMQAQENKSQTPRRADEPDEYQFTDMSILRKLAG